MRAGRDAVRRFVTEATLEFRQLIGIENMFDAICTTIYQSGIEIGLSEQVDLPQSVASHGVSSRFGSVRCELVATG